MQSKSGPLSDLGNLLTNAAGALKGVGDEVKAMGRAQGEKMVSELDLVTRDEFEIMRARLDKLEAQNASLKKKLTKMEKTVKALK